MWGTFWVWDARLTSVLILLFLYLGYIALHDAFDDPGARRARGRDPVPGRLGQPADHQVLGRLVEHAAPAGQHPARRRAGDRFQHAVAAACDVSSLLVLFRGGAYLPNARRADRAQDPQPAPVGRSRRVEPAGARRPQADEGEQPCPHPARLWQGQPGRPPAAPGRRRQPTTISRCRGRGGEARRHRPPAVLAQGAVREPAAPRGRPHGHARAARGAGRLAGQRRSDQEIAFRPARVLMQDFTGVPAVVDLAAMRQAMRRARRRPAEDQPAVAGRSGDRPLGPGRRLRPARRLRAQRRAASTSATPSATPSCAGAQHAFDNFRVVPPGTGICHQVNLEYLAQVVWTAPEGNRERRLSRHAGRHRQPHHDDQRPGRARLGRRRHRGRGGDARPADLDADPGGGRLQAHRPAARGRDRDRPGADRDRRCCARKGVVGKFVEFCGAGPRPSAARRSRHDRQHGARVRRHLRHLPDRRRRRSTTCG